MRILEHEGGAGRPPGDEITALVRSPDSVFVHWRLGGPRSGEVARELGPECRWVVRVLDLSEGASETIPVAAESGSCYVAVRPGHIYGFELAARTPQKWRTICRTGRVEVPSARPAVRQPGPARLPAVEKLRKSPAAPPPEPGLSAEATPMPSGSSPAGPPS